MSAYQSKDLKWSQVMYGSVFLGLGEFLWSLHHCAWPWGPSVYEGRWQEILETALLPTSGLWIVLLTQRQDKGQLRQPRQ